MGCLRNKKPSEEAVLLDPAGTPGEERLRAGKPVVRSLSFEGLGQGYNRCLASLKDWGRLGHQFIVV